jgi:outer membrane protein OmpA-like peptidoglycan-associated protein
MSKRVAVLVLASMALGACSAVPDWARPSNVADRLLGREAAPATNQFPSVGDVPRQAPATTNPAQRQATIAGLAADRANAQYTDEQLRQGGQVAAVAPAPAVAAAPTAPVTQTPLAAPPPQVAQVAPRPAPLGGTTAPNLAVPDLAVPVPPIFQGGPQVTLGQPAAAQPLPPPAVAVVPAPAAPARTPAPIAPPPAIAGVPITPPPAPISPAPIAVAPIAPAQAPLAQAPATAVAPIGPAAVPPPPAVQAPPAPVATPVVPAPPSPVPTQAQVNRVLPPQNAGGQDTLARTFAQMLQQSQQTVTVQSPLGGPATGVSPVVPQQTLPPPAAAGALPLSGAAGIATPRATAAGTSTFNLSAAPSQAASVAFSHDSATLSPEARRTIRSVADAYKARGGGHVRVVGHSSMRTRDMPVDVHVLTNFRVSLDRAKAVADELLRLGVPPSALIVDAVGDAQPRFLEAMPAGEAGNRRVELYVEA